MHVFVDDSGDGGFKLGAGSSSHLIMSACVFRDPKEIEHLAANLAQCRIRASHQREFKYSKTSDKVKQHFFEAIADVDFAVRAIIIDKQLVYSPKLRSEPAAFKSWAIRQLLTKNFGQIQNARVVIDGQDTRGFGVSDERYLMGVVNRSAPGTISSVKFDDSRRNIGIQLADMTAGAINRSRRLGRHKKDRRDLDTFIARTHQPRGTFWLFH